MYNTTLEAKLTLPLVVTVFYSLITVSYLSAAQANEKFNAGFSRGQIVAPMGGDMQ